MRDRDGGSSSTSQNKHRSAHMDGWNDGLLISVGSVPNCNMLAVGISSSSSSSSSSVQPELLKIKTTQERANGKSAVVGWMLVNLMKAK